MVSLVILWHAPRETDQYFDVHFCYEPRLNAKPYSGNYSFFDGFSREASLVSRETRRVSRETCLVSRETRRVSRETRCVSRDSGNLHLSGTVVGY